MTPDALIVAFVQGAKWWEYHQTGATMWASDQDQAEGHAEEMARNGTLGKFVRETIYKARKIKTSEAYLADTLQMTAEELAMQS